MSMSCKLWLKYKDYLIYDENGEEMELSEDAPPEAKEAYKIEERALYGTFDKHGVKIRP